VFIPYRVDVPFDRRPVMNWIILLAVFAVFALQVVEIAQSIAEDPGGETGPVSAEDSVGQAGPSSSGMSQFVLDGWSIRGLFGYMWLHGGILHLFGNMLFLWLFGNAVCSKLGGLLYMPVYIGLGVFAGLCHLLFADGPVLGASGAINGIVGMYLIFFPENDISCVFFLLWYPIRFSLSSYWMILLWFVLDIIGLVRGSGGVAYVAHVGGFLAGFILAVVMLKTGLVVMQRDEKTLLELVGVDSKPRHPARRRDLPHWQADWQSEPTEPEPTPSPEVDTIPLEPAQQFIRFQCKCGQKVKVPAAHAGKIGRCPKCSKKIRIPTP